MAAWAQLFAMTLDGPLKAWGDALARVAEDPGFAPPPELRAAVIAAWWGVCTTFGLVGPDFVRILAVVSAGSLSATAYVIPSFRAVSIGRRKRAAREAKAT